MKKKQHKLKLGASLLLVFSLLFMSCNQEEEVITTTNNVKEEIGEEQLLREKDTEKLDTPAELANRERVQVLRAAELKNVYSEKRVAKTYYVPADYDYISDALDRAKPRDIVVVTEGSYNEDLDMVKNTITLKATTGVVLEGTITINANNVSVSGFIIEPEDGDSGIDIDDSRNVTISNNTIKAYNNECIDVDNSPNTTISDNVLNATGDDDGIQIDESRASHILDNTITTEDDGMYIGTSNGITIVGNKITGILESKNEQGIDMNNIDKALVTNNSCTNFWDGIDLSFSDNNIIKRNNTYKNVRGIRVGYSFKNEIIQNQCLSNSYYGIYLYSNQSENIIEKNIAYFNGIFDIHEVNSNCGNDFISNYTGSESLNGSSNCNN